MGAMGNRGGGSRWSATGLWDGYSMAMGYWGGIWGPTVGLEGADPQLHHGAVVQDLGGNMKVREEYGDDMGLWGEGSIGVYGSPGGEYCGGTGQLQGSWGGSMGSYGWVMEVYGKGDSGGEYMVL